MNALEREDGLTLEILSTIDGSCDVTQRHIADRLGVALGLANAYLRRCIRKGLVKIQHAPANRYLYYLTPMGLTEKSRLTLKYLSASLALYRSASESYSILMRHCVQKGWKRLVLSGASELAEIAMLRVREAGLDVAAILDADSGLETFLGCPIVRDARALPEADAIVMTCLSDPNGAFVSIRSAGTRLPILVPDFLSPACSADVHRESQRAAEPRLSPN